MIDSNIPDYSVVDVIELTDSFSVICVYGDYLVVFEDIHISHEGVVYDVSVCEQVDGVTKCIESPSDEILQDCDAIIWDVIASDAV